VQAFAKPVLHWITADGARAGQARALTSSVGAQAEVRLERPFAIDEADRAAPGFPGCPAKLDQVVVMLFTVHGSSPS